MQAFNFKNVKLFWLFMPLLVATVFVGCSKDDDDEPDAAADPIASFQFAIDANDFLTVDFSNFSQNATSYSWDFGDGNTSTEESPSHTYAAAMDYEVVLTATNADNKSAMKSETITITDPNAALKLLTGESSKTWKLFREGISMSLGPDASNPTQFWAGLSNDGTRPCLYEQEITFGTDGSYTFNDNGMFWGEFGVWGSVASCPMNTPFFEVCFDADPANMVNACGDDVSKWLSGTHQFTYDASAGDLVLTGEGAWIGIPKLGTTGETIVPVSEVATKVSIEEFVGYDVMTVEFIYADTYWPIKYVSYSDASLEPDLVTEAGEFGEDLDDISPMTMGHTFESAGGSDLLDTITSASTVVYGVDDPADAGAAKVGQFNRTGDQFQELQFQTSPTKNDFNFENLTTVSVDVYLPSTNDYSGELSKKVIIGLGDRSQTEQWWTDNMEWINEGDMLAEDEWVTLTYQLDMPSYAAMGGTPFDRNDFDMVYVQIGGGNHTVPGTFFVRNLRFE